MRAPSARWRNRQDDEGGFVAIVFAVVVSTLAIVCLAIALDTGQWYVAKSKIQKAADAAALGGVPFLPNDLASARQRALDIAKTNGFDDALSTVDVQVSQGNPATQLVVKISAVVPNQFGAMIGVRSTSVSGAATADYQGPAPMGSPCNTFGNEPSAGTTTSVPPGVGSDGSALGTGVPANCSRTPAFWANVEGPQTGKVQGDRYQTLVCENGAAGSPPGGVDGCDGSDDNQEYSPFGYTFLVKVQPAFFNANGTAKSSIGLQLFDPQFTAVGQACGALPPRTYYTYGNNGWSQPQSPFPDDTGATNPFTTNRDARNRYVSPANDNSARDTCTGDSFPGTTGANRNGDIPVTSFVLREQTDSLNPRLAAPVAGCTRQYGGVDLPVIAAYTSRDGSTGSYRVNPNVFKQGTNNYLPQVAELFHNWTTMCTFTPARPGDYYLQVRTNVALGGTVNGFTSSGNTAASAPEGNTEDGAGSNAFAIRAATGSGLQRFVSVSGNDHMPIYVNADPDSSGPSTFNLIRVLPGARGQRISFSYFDAGDAQGSGSVKVLPPTDMTSSETTLLRNGCTSYGGSADTGTQTSPTVLTDCTAPITKQSGSTTSKNNGRAQTITIPIPSDYTCSFSSFSGCWYRVQIIFGSGAVTDVTTWDATVIGDPVRLVK